MMEVLQFIFQSFWHFMGFLILFIGFWGGVEDVIKALKDK
jgi:hypothetical protein